jgi:hypothetical protein
MALSLKWLLYLLESSDFENRVLTTVLDFVSAQEMLY